MRTVQQVIEQNAERYEVSVQEVEQILKDLKARNRNEIRPRHLREAVNNYQLNKIEEQRQQYKEMGLKIDGTPDKRFKKHDNPDRKYNTNGRVQGIKNKNKYLKPPQYMNEDMKDIYIEKAAALEARGALSSESAHLVQQYASSWYMCQALIKKIAAGEDVDVKDYRSLRSDLDNLNKAMEGDAVAARKGIHVKKEKKQQKESLFDI